MSGCRRPRSRRCSCRPLLVVAGKGFHRSYGGGSDPRDVRGTPPEHPRIPSSSPDSRDRRHRPQPGEQDVRALAADPPPATSSSAGGRPRGHRRPQATDRRAGRGTQRRRRHHLMLGEDRPGTSSEARRIGGGQPAPPSGWRTTTISRSIEQWGRGRWTTLLDLRGGSARRGRARIMSFESFVLRRHLPLQRDLLPDAAPPDRDRSERRPGGFRPPSRRSRPGVDRSEDSASSARPTGRRGPCDPRSTDDGSRSRLTTDLRRRIGSDGVKRPSSEIPLLRLRGRTRATRKVHGCLRPSVIPTSFLQPRVASLGRPPEIRHPIAQARLVPVGPAGDAAPDPGGIRRVDRQLPRRSRRRQPPPGSDGRGHLVLRRSEATSVSRMRSGPAAELPDGRRKDRCRRSTW